MPILYATHFLIENVFNKYLFRLFSDNNMVSNWAARIFSCSRPSPDMKMVHYDSKMVCNCGGGSGGCM